MNSYQPRMSKRRPFTVNQLHLLPLALPCIWKPRGLNKLNGTHRADSRWRVPLPISSSINWQHKSASSAGFSSSVWPFLSRCRPGAHGRRSENAWHTWLSIIDRRTTGLHTANLRTLRKYPEFKDSPEPWEWWWRRWWWWWDWEVGCVHTVTNWSGNRTKSICFTKTNLNRSLGVRQKFWAIDANETHLCFRCWCRCVVSSVYFLFAAANWNLRTDALAGCMFLCHFEFGWSVIVVQILSVWMNI